MENFKILFDNLKADHLDSASVTGRKPLSRKNPLKAMIFKNLTGLSTLTDIASVLRNNSSAAIRFSFDILKPLHNMERYLEFLRTTENTALRGISINLVHELIPLGVIMGNYLPIDSGPVYAKVKENNLKTNVKNRFSKGRTVKCDPDARLGIMVTGHLHTLE